MVANSSVGRGITPHNITVHENVVEQLGRGCHYLTLSASNRITTHSVSTELQVCLLGPVEGLQASVMAEEGQCPDSSDLIISVSLERGAPVQLLFSLSGANDKLSESRDMNGSLQGYTFSSPIEGTQSLSCTTMSRKFKCNR